MDNISNSSAVAQAKALINEGKATCIVIRDGKIARIKSDSGIVPIIEMYDEGVLDGSVVVDKIVGRAAAMIMTLGGVQECIGLTVSQGALDFFNQNGIKAEYTSCPEHIINRRGDGICPMESAVEGIYDPQKALNAVRETLAKLKKESK